MSHAEPDTADQLIIPITLRYGAQAEDETFLVLSAWINGAKNNDMFKAVAAQSYFENYRPFVRKVLGASQILFACNPDDSNHIYGFTVFRRVGDVVIISCVYVKATFRKMHVARRMIEELTRDTAHPEARAFITHTTWFLSDVLKKHGLVYNPFLDLKLLGDKK